MRTHTQRADTYIFLTQGLLPHIYGVRYVHEDTYIAQYADTYTADTYIFLTQGLLPHIHRVRYVHEEFAEEAPDEALLREPMLEGHAVYLLYSVYLLD
jgi:hypothetical protein